MELQIVIKAVIFVLMVGITEQNKQQAITVQETIGILQKLTIMKNQKTWAFVLNSDTSNFFVTFMKIIKNLNIYVSIHTANGEMLNSNKISTLYAKCQGHKITVESHNLLSAELITFKVHKVIVERGKRTILKQCIFRVYL